MKQFLVISLLVVIVLSSCRLIGKRIKGSGSVTVQTHSVSGYSNVDVGGAIDVYVKQDSTHSVRVETDDNLHEYMDISQEGGTLYIDVKKNYNLKPSKGIKVYVAGPSFRKFRASGACDLFTEGPISNNEDIVISLSGSCDAQMEIKAPRTKASLTGAGSLVLSGQTRDLELDGTGSSRMRCMNMLAENVDVDITGSGNAEVFASVKLDVSVTGSGNVKYKGNASVSQKVSGSGSVKKLD
jgi:hypothetical protein